MSVRGKPGDFFRVKILGMRLRIASAYVPYTCRNGLRIHCRVPSIYRNGYVARFELGMTCTPSWENRSSADFLWVFQNRRKA